MRSNYSIQDFFRSVPENYLVDKEGVIVLDSFDPISYKLSKSHLLKKIKVHHKNYDEVTKEWLEEEFQNLGFFNQADHFFIHQADKIKIDLLRFIVQLKIAGRLLILSFNDQVEIIKKMEKEGELIALVLDAPKFWETSKLLDFSINYFKLPLTHSAKEWMVSFVPSDFFSYYNACSILDLNYQNVRQIDVADVELTLKKEKFDHFELAQLFCRKKMKDFCTRLLDLESTFDHYRSFFGFMQSHLIKIKDPSYLGQKAKLSQYDKDILSFNQAWAQSDLTRWIEYFNNLEILCKRRDDALWQKLQHLQVKLINI